MRLEGLARDNDVTQGDSESTRPPCNKMRTCIHKYICYAVQAARVSQVVQGWHIDDYGSPDALDALQVLLDVVQYCLPLPPNLYLRIVSRSHKKAM